MKRQEFLLNLTLLVIIGTLVYLIYDHGETARTSIDDIEVPALASATKKSPRVKAPGKETSYDGNTTATGENGEDATEGENGESKFGQTNIFRALLTPTPTPTPPPTPPPPTPDIDKALGPWKLVSLYDGKAMLEDVVMSQKGEEGAIFELAPGQTKQVDVGGGIMKTATLKKIEATNPYNPEIILGLEGTTAERKINLDTEPAVAAPGPAPGQPAQPGQAAPKPQ